MYLIAGVCGLYLSIAPFFTSFHGPITFFRVGMWIGTVLLLIAAILPARSIDLTIRDSYRVVHTAPIFALLGSTATTVLLVYGIARFVAFRLGYIHGKGQLVMYQPNVFDRVNQIVSRPILLLFLVSSVASLVIAVIILHRSSPPLLTETSGK